MPVRLPAVYLGLIRPVGEVDGLCIEIRHRVAHDTCAAVKESLHFRSRGIQSSIAVVWDSEHADSSTGCKQRIHMLAVVVRRMKWVALCKKHTLERRESGIAEKESALGLPRRQEERVRTRSRRILRLPAELGEFGLFPVDVESQRRQPCEHLLKLDKRALQRRQP